MSRSGFDDLGSWARTIELWWSRAAGIHAMVARRRLEELVAFARARSPYYGRLYARIPERWSLRDLPVVTRAGLMDHFDDWATDRRIRRSGVERFLAGRRHIGDRFLGRYIAWKSSGSTGVSGLFVQDPGAIAVYDSLVGARSLADASTALRTLAGLGRAAVVVATEDHYASIASWTRLRRNHPGWHQRSLSALAPLDETVRALNEFSPRLLASYPSMLSILADERRAGRLTARPSILWSGGERLALGEQRRIERAFGCPVVNEYGASECLSIAHGCEHGWLHLDAEWVILEPVDAAGKPTPRGRISHTTLLTNLANRVQPLIRYDLGDRITLRKGRCPCGDGLPAFRVEGRCDEIVSLCTAHGRHVRLSPLALGTVVERAVGGRRFQVAQASPRALWLRLDRADVRGRAAAWKRAENALHAWLASQGLDDVRVRLDRRAPRLDARSGKLRQVVSETR